MLRRAGVRAAPQPTGQMGQCEPRGCRGICVEVECPFARRGLSMVAQGRDGAGAPGRSAAAAWRRTMQRYLIIANQTLGGAELADAVRERVGAGPCEFWVV